MMGDPNSKATTHPARHHPLIGQRRNEGRHRVVYSATYSPQTHWVLDEHRVEKGLAVLPGTAYIEIARLAAEQEHPGVGVEIDDLALLAPLSVGDHESREVRITLDESEPNEWKLLVSSKTQGGNWLANARATVRALTVSPPAPIGFTKIMARCRMREVQCGPNWNSKQERRLIVGRRWRCLQRVLLGHDEGVAAIEIEPEFAADLTSFSMHPALLDQATGFALPLINGYEAGDDFYVPMAYQRVRIWRPLTQKLTVHARYRGAVNNNTVAFDLTIVDEAGEVAVDIAQFLMRRIDSHSSFITPEQTAANTHSTGGNTFSPLDELMANGIPPQQGLEALHRILAHRTSPPQIIVSPTPLDILERRLISTNGNLRGIRGRRNSRPLVAARTPIEEYLVEAWSRVLGIESVSVEDNWYELGGHSLLSIRILAQLRHRFRIEFSPDLFAGSPTISAQARAVDLALAKSAPTDHGPIPVGREQFRRTRQSLDLSDGH